MLEAYGHHAPATALTFSPDGTLLASGTVDKSFVLWNMAGGTNPRRLMGHTGTVVSVAFSPEWQTNRLCLSRQDSPIAAF